MLKNIFFVIVFHILTMKKEYKLILYVLYGNTVVVSENRFPELLQR